MSTDIISRVRVLVEEGSVTKSGLARAAGLHANTLRDLDSAEWNPTSETLRKLEEWLAYGSDGSPMATPEEIIAYARNHLAGFKCPKTIDFIDALPRNPSGKILRRELREPFWAGRERQVN